MTPTDREDTRKIMVIDTKSFYASCECVSLGLNLLKAMAYGYESSRKYKWRISTGGIPNG